MTGFWGRLPRPFHVLAPMENVTDTVFRQIVIRCGPPQVFFTEFTDASGLFSRHRDRFIHRLQFTPAERPLVAQIWGTTPEHYHQAAKLIAELGFDGVDINMGCPVPKIVKKGCCAALIDNPTLAKELIHATKEGAGEIPVSVKTRIGFEERKTIPWASFLLDQGIAALSVHGRVAKDLSNVPADWDAIAQIVGLRDERGDETLIIGNGDVLSLAEVAQKHEATGVDGVMIGRGIFRNPFLFSPSRPHIDTLDASTRLSLLRDHIDLWLETWGDDKHFAIMKKFFKVYVANFPGATELQASLMRLNNADEILQIVDEAFLAFSPEP